MLTITGVVLPTQVDVDTAQVLFAAEFSPWQLEAIPVADGYDFRIVNSNTGASPDNGELALVLMKLIKRYHTWMGAFQGNGDARQGLILTLLTIIVLSHQNLLSTE